MFRGVHDSPIPSAPTVSVSPLSIAELMAGASLLVLRSISSMTPCISEPERLWKSIAEEAEEEGPSCCCC